MVLEFGLKSCFVSKCLKAIFYHMPVFFQTNTAAKRSARGSLIKPGNNFYFANTRPVVTFHGQGSIFSKRKSVVKTQTDRLNCKSSVLGTTCD